MIVTKFALGQKVFVRKYETTLEGVVAGITLPGHTQYLVVLSDDVEACYTQVDREWMPENWLSERT